MRDRVEYAHAREPVQQRADRRQQHIEPADVARRARDPRREPLVLERPRRLGLVELHAADAEHRQQRDRQHDHADAAEPLDLLPVEQDRRRHLVEADEHGRAGRRVARRRFEERVGEARVEREHERHGAEHAHRGPHQRDDQEAVAAADVRGLLVKRQPKRESREQRDRERDREPSGLAVAVEERDRDRRQQRRAEQQEQHAESAEDYAESHGVLPRIRYARQGGRAARRRRRRPPPHAAYRARAQDLMQNAFSLLPSRSRKYAA